MNDPRDDPDRDDPEERSDEDREIPDDDRAPGEDPETSAGGPGERADEDRAKPGSGDVDPRSGEQPPPREDSARDDPVGPEGEIDGPGRYEGVDEEIGTGTDRGRMEGEASPAGDPDRAAGEASPGGGIDTPDEASTRDYEGANEKVDEQTAPAGTADRTGAGRAGAESNREGGPTAGRRDEGSRLATEQRRRNVPVVAGLAAVVGAWVAVSPLLLDGAGEAGLWNDVLVGAAVLVAAGYNYYRLSDDRRLSVGVAALVALLGLWLVVSAPLLGMTGGVLWSTVASGVLVAGLAGYNAYEARSAEAGAPEAW